MFQEEEGSDELCFVLGSQAEWTWESSVQPIIRLVGWNVEMQPFFSRNLPLGMTTKPSGEATVEPGRGHDGSLPVWNVDVVPSWEYDETLLIKSVEALVFDVFGSQWNSLCLLAFWAHSRKVNIPLDKAWNWVLAPQFCTDLALIQGNWCLGFERGKPLGFFLLCVSFQFIIPESSRSQKTRFCACLKPALEFTLTHPV